MHQSGKGLQDFGKNQINDNSLSKVIFYPDSKEVFGKLIDISDGITIVVKKKNKRPSKVTYLSIRIFYRRIIFFNKNSLNKLYGLKEINIPLH